MPASIWTADSWGEGKIKGVKPNLIATVLAGADEEDTEGVENFLLSLREHSFGCFLNGNA